MKLTIVYTKNEDGKISAAVPSLPGCLSWGKTKRDARKNINEAIQLYLEDMLAQGEHLPQEIEAEVVEV